MIKNLFKLIKDKLAELVIVLIAFALPYFCGYIMSGKFFNNFVTSAISILSFLIFMVIIGIQRVWVSELKKDVNNKNPQV